MSARLLFEYRSPAYKNVTYVENQINFGLDSSFNLEYKKTEQNKQKLYPFRITVV